MMMRIILIIMKMRMVPLQSFFLDLCMELVCDIVDIDILGSFHLDIGRFEAIDSI